jgi:hypothetical protein
MRVDQAALRMADEATNPPPPERPLSPSAARYVDGPPRLASGVYHGDHVLPGSEVQEAVAVGHVAGQEEAFVRTAPSRLLTHVPVSDE